MEDLRKWIYLATDGKTAHAEGTQASGQDENHPLRYAPDWAAWMLNYSDALIANFTEAQTSDLFFQTRPGGIVVWFEDSFSSNISGVEFSSNEKGELIIPNCQQITKNGIYNWNGTGNPVPQSETWYKEFDDWRPGTPFLLTGCTDARNNGFYRVSSRRMVGSTLYISANYADGRPAQFFEETAGTMSCNFGGDWWCLLGLNGHVSDMLWAHQSIESYLEDLEDWTYWASGSGKLWTAKDSYHRYAGNARGPNDGRPPSGGQWAIDYNNDWIRAVNPNLYHTYDVNAHRYEVISDWEDNTVYWAIWPAYKRLNIETDPKEQIPPWFCQDKKNARWKYGGKVPLRKNQICNALRLGPVDAPKAMAWHDSGGWHAIATHRQYHTSYIVPALLAYQIKFGTIPVSAGDNGLYQWEQNKYDDSVQVMAEFAAEQYGWALQVDDTYIHNWFAVYHPSWGEDVLPEALEWTLYGDIDNRTYQEAYNDFGIAAYRPDLDASAPAYAELHDELWGENGSATELILKKMGTDYYDWYYDTSTPFISERVLKIRTLFLANPGYWTFPTTVHGVVCSSIEDVANVCWPIPAGTWRRTWKHTLGYIREGKMRASELGEPTCQDYQSLGWVNPDDPMRMPMPGHHRFSAPAEEQFGGDNLAANHGARFVINDTPIYASNVCRILNDVYEFLSYLTISYISSTSIGLYEYSDNTQNYQEIFLEEDESIRQFATLEELIGTVKTVLKENYTDNLLPPKWTLSNDNIVLAGHNGVIYYDVYDTAGNFDPGWRLEMTYFSYKEAAVLFESNLPYDSGAVNILMKIEVKEFFPVNPAYDPPCPIRLGITGLGTVDVKILSRTNPPPIDLWDVYWVNVSLDTTRRVMYIRPVYGVDNIVPNKFNNGPTGARYANTAEATLRVSFLSSEECLIGQFSFGKFSDKIWKRPIEKADVRLIDPFGDDNNPPVYDNGFQSPPLLYNANWEEYPQSSVVYGTCYDYDLHVPEYRVSAESVLMEDLEGLDEDEVHYIFDFGTTDLADEMDKEQTNRVFDEPLLDGDEESAVEVYQDDFSLWQVVLNSRDNAEARGNDHNNYGQPSEPEEIALDDKTMPHLPLKPIVHYEKIQISDVWYDHIWVEPPYAEEELAYRLAVWDSLFAAPRWVILYGFGASKPAAPSGYADGDNHFWISGSNVSETSKNSYRIQCRAGGAVSGVRGMWSNAAPPLSVLLTLRNSGGYSQIKINGQPAVFQGGVLTRWFDWREEIVLSCEDAGEYFSWYIQWSNGQTSTSDNPLTITLFADLEITAY